MSYPIVTLKKSREKSLQRFHPWVFSGAIESASRELKEGELVKVVDIENNCLGIGHCCSGSLAIKMLSNIEEEIDQLWFSAKIKAAYEARSSMGLPSAETNCYRLVHGEGDFLPGLIIDIYNEVAVIQPHSVGMELSLSIIREALKSIGFINILHKPIDRSNKTEVLAGEVSELIRVKESGIQFDVDVLSGQKTGFFLDQRANRDLLRGYSNGKSILNVFSYTGGFSLAALAGGASEAISLDSSARALALADQNALTLAAKGKHQSLKTDALPFLEKMDEAYDIIVLDPPAFAKHKSARHSAVKAYQRINEAGIRNVKSGGLLFTFSCSQVVDQKLFCDTVMAAAINVGRKATILHRLRQPADHPVSIFHPEGEYLKGLVMRIT